MPLMMPPPPEGHDGHGRAWLRPLGKPVRWLLRLPPTPVALAAVWVVAGAFALGSREAVREQAVSQATLFARVLADHASRTLGGVDLALAAAAGRLADQMDGRPDSLADGAVQRILGEVASSQPLMRSLSLVNATGQVQASSQRENLGANLPERYFRHPRSFMKLPMVLATGRDLLELADPGNPGSTPSRRHMFIVSQPLGEDTGLAGQLWLVATLNPDYFANQYEVMLDSPGWQAAMSSLDGRFLAGTSNLPMKPGDTVLARMPDGERPAEAGAVDGTSIGDQPALGAFRLARMHPVAVQAQLPHHLAYAPWRESLKRTLAAAGAVSLLVLGLSQLSARHRRARELADAQRQAVQLQLREQYELTEQLIDAMPVPVVRTDLAGNIQQTNRALTSWMRLDVDLPQGPATVERDRRVQRLLEHGNAEVVSTGHHTWPLDLPTGDGNLRETIVTKVALRGPQGQVLGVIGTLADVTEFRQAARAIDSARRAAEASNAARAEFVANVTHELRTPLQSILGFAELGIDRAAGHDRLVLMYQRIHDAGSRMLRLVEDLLDISRIGSTVGSIQLQPMAVARPLVDVVEELRQLAQSKGRSLELEVEEALYLAEAKIDAARLQQVARNVIANALRFSPPDSHIEISMRQEGPDAVVRVRDHGPGIPPDETQAIFEPFVQSSRTKDGSGGTGLGLAICRQIIQAHHGQISAHNHPEAGAIFRFSVPLIQGEPTGEDEAESLASA